MNLRRKLRRLSRRQLRHGCISQEEYDQILTVLEDDMAFAEAEIRINRLKTPWRDCKQIDFSRVWEWLKENWLMIVQILFAVLPLIIAEKPTLDEEETEDED